MRKLAYKRGGCLILQFQKSRKVKENGRKAKKRKEERLRKTQEELKSEIIKLDFKEGADHCIT